MPMIHRKNSDFAAFIGAQSLQKPAKYDDKDATAHAEMLALTQAGISREDSYAIVQRNAMKVWESDGQLSLLELLKADPEVAAVMSAAELEEKFNLDYHFAAVDTIFARVFGE